MFRICFISSLLLIAGGFFCPPIGVIDGSVLSAVGLLLMFATLAQIPQFLKSINGGKSIKLQKGDLSIEAGSMKDLNRE